MSSKIDRRSFLTHSAATVGGIAMAGTVVDDLLATAAGAAVGVNSGKPKMGGTLKVGLLSDVPNYHIFNGAQGKMDVSGFCVANALYDPLFVSAANGKTWLPMLALSATPNSNYTVWTVALRQGVTFTNGDPFNADIVVQNFQAAAADQTVGLAVRPIIGAVTKVDDYTVQFNLVIPFSTFPYSALSEQQTCYMAHPSSFSPSFTGTPVGTGPFTVSSWQVGVQSVFARNKGYWRADAAGRQLPYLNGVIFKTIVDDNARNQALQSGSVDMILSQDGTSIAALEKMKGISYLTDQNAPRDPSLNCLILNTTGTLNQYFAWAGYFSTLGIPGALPLIEKGEAVPTAVQQAIYYGTAVAVDPSSLTWNPKLTSPLADPTIRQACAMAINRSTYQKVIASGVGAVADSIYRPTSPYYRKGSYPAYNPKQAKSLVQAYMSKNNVTSVSFVIDIVSGSSSEAKAFAFFKQQLGAVGITVAARPLTQSTLIQNVIYGEYDCATWNQFGGADPALNYVWFNSQPATTAPPSGLGLTALPAGTFIAGAVNFAHQADPVVEQSMLTAMAAKPGSAPYIAGWAAINTQFVKDLPYLYLTKLVSAWGARPSVQNWSYATAGDGRTRCLNPDGGSARWDQIWKS
jgi:ABC-type transport system substrate-binding protein